jgi:rhodanese-related sulfurtransferase
VAQQLGEQGFMESFALRGGFDAWKRAGGPTERK